MPGLRGLQVYETNDLGLVNRYFGVVLYYVWCSLWLPSQIWSNNPLRLGPSRQLAFQASMSRAKGKGVNVTSFFDLKAEISKQEEEFAKSKVAGKSNYVVGGIKRPDKVSYRSSLSNSISRSVWIETNCLGSPESGLAISNFSWYWTGSNKQADTRIGALYPGEEGKDIW